MWHSEFNKADAYHVCNRLLKTGLKSRILRKFKIQTSKHTKNSSTTSRMSGNEAILWRKISQGKAEVDEVYTWNKADPEDHTEAELLAEVNKVYHRYGRYSSQWGYWALGPRPQGIRAPFRGS